MTDRLHGRAHCPQCASPAIYLTEDELQQLIDYVPKDLKGKYVRNVFILSSFTGARHSDSAQFNDDNLIGYTGSVENLSPIALY